MTELEHIMIITSQVTNMSEESIISDTNKEQYVRARMVFANVLHRVYPHINYSESGRFILRHRTSINHYINSHEGRMMSDKLYKSYFYAVMASCKPDYLEDYPDKSLDELRDLLKWHEREAGLIRKVLEV